MASILRMTEKLLMPTGVRLCRRLPQPVIISSVRVRSTANTTVPSTWGYQYRPTPRLMAGTACTSKQATALPRDTSAYRVSSGSLGI